MSRKFDEWLEQAHVGELASERAAKEAWVARSETCASALELSQSQIRLMAGEMTAQEMRTVQAVLNGLAAQIRRGE